MVELDLPGNMAFAAINSHNHSLMQLAHRFWDIHYGRDAIFTRYDSPM